MESSSSIEAKLRMEGVELKEEWQDEDFPRPLPEDDHVEELPDATGRGDPSEVNGHKGKKKLLAPNISLALDRSEESVLSDELDESGEIDLDDLDTPSENSNEYEWEGDLRNPNRSSDLGRHASEYFRHRGERGRSRAGGACSGSGSVSPVDMKAIEPYRKVIRTRRFVIGTLELLVAENYMIIYLNATTRRKMPSLGWLRKCYQQIDRRLKKNLKSLIIVHPSWFIRTLLAITKPFISSKFSQKIRYVFTLEELAQLVPVESVGIPDCIKQ
uniref:BCL2/adenovirus E1B 19 kDa protein-interacting protein 2 n=1 Tax=Sphaerodactylus townsendi TaxID=933632 RepID=A0ACB8E4Z2_9SAUR